MSKTGKTIKNRYACKTPGCNYKCAYQYRLKDHMAREKNAIALGTHNRSTQRNFNYSSLLATAKCAKQVPKIDIDFDQSAKSSYELARMDPEDKKIRLKFIRQGKDVPSNGAIDANSGESGVIKSKESPKRHAKKSVGSEDSDNLMKKLTQTLLTNQNDIATTIEEHAKSIDRNCNETKAQPNLDGKMLQCEDQLLANYSNKIPPIGDQLGVVEIDPLPKNEKAPKQKLVTYSSPIMFDHKQIFDGQAIDRVLVEDSITTRAQVKSNCSEAPRSQGAREASCLNDDLQGGTKSYDYDDENMVLFADWESDEDIEPDDGPIESDKAIQFENDDDKVESVDSDDQEWESCSESDEHEEELPPPPSQLITMLRIKEIRNQLKSKKQRL